MGGALKSLRRGRVPWVGLLAGAGAALLGRDVALRGGDAGLSELLYYAVVATAGIPALQAQWALYERTDRMTLLPLPIEPRHHLIDAAWITLAKVCPLALTLVGLAAGAGLADGGAHEALRALLQVAGSLVCSILSGFGIAALAGRAALPTRSESWARLRQTLSGGWAAAEHAPFFWAPGLAVAVSAISAAGVQRGPVPAAFALLGSTAIALAAPGAYRRALFHVAPLAAEHARSVYGGQTPPPASPVGLSIGAVLPAGARPFFVKDATQLGRITRGRGVLAGLGIAGVSLAALRTDAAPWVAGAGVALVGSFAMAAIRLARPDAAPAWLERTLPIRRTAPLLGRAAAAALLPSLVGCLVAGGLVLAGAPLGRAAYVAAAAVPLALAATLLARLRSVASWSYAMLVGGAAVTAAWIG